MKLSKFQTKKTKFSINFSTFKMAKVQIFAISYVEHAKTMQKVLKTICKSFIN